MTPRRPAPQGSGHATTARPPVRDRTERLLAYEAFKAGREELPAILAAYKPSERAS